MVRLMTENKRFYNVSVYFEIKQQTAAIYEVSNETGGKSRLCFVNKDTGEEYGGYVDSFANPNPSYHQNIRKVLLLKFNEEMALFEIAEEEILRIKSIEKGRR